MVIKVAAPGGRVHFIVGIAVNHGKKLFGLKQAKRQHKGLVAVVPRAPVAFAKGFCHGKLGYFFAIAKNAKMGPAVVYLPPSEQT